MITLNGTTGITTPDITSEAGLTADGVSFASGAPANTLVTTSAGNVGIGTSSPATRLHVDGSTSLTTIRVESELSNSSYFSGVEFVRNGTVAGAIMQSYRNPAIGGVGFVWSTTADNAAEVSGPYTQRMFLDSSGSLLLGTTGSFGGLNIDSKYGTLSSNVLIWLNTNITNSRYMSFEFGGNGGSGSITPNGTNAVSYNTTSDYRLKSNPRPLTNALDRVMQLEPCEWEWKADGSQGVGFIAHKVQAIRPQAVTGKKDAVDKDGKPIYQGMDASFLIADLTAAIQEQQAMIESLTQRIAALEGAAQ